MRYLGSEGEGAGSSVARSICSRQSVAYLVLWNFLGQQLKCFETYYFEGTFEFFLRIGTT